MSLCTSAIKFRTDDKSSIKQEEDYFPQKTAIKFEERRSALLYLEH
jgi:hypothetical protein